MAFSVIYGELGTAFGATYKSPIIFPHAEPEQLDPVTVHSTAFASVPVTVAVTTCDRQQELADSVSQRLTQIVDPVAALVV